MMVASIAAVSTMLPAMFDALPETRGDSGRSLGQSSEEKYLPYNKRMQSDCQKATPFVSG